MNKLDKTPDFIKLYSVEESIKHRVKQGKGDGVSLDTEWSPRPFRWHQTSDASGSAFQTDRGSGRRKAL